MSRCRYCGHVAIHWGQCRGLACETCGGLGIVKRAGERGPQPCPDCRLIDDDPAVARRMSCSLTIDAVKARTKTVTRRVATTWTNLKPGDRLRLVEKAQGLAKGERQVSLALVEVTAVELVPLDSITDDDLVAEGFADLDRAGFVRFWLGTHHEHNPSTLVRRIEWRYLDE